MLFTNRRISPNGLRIFEAAARHLSFTAAAKELRSTQSAVSQQVRNLEEQLGLKLFDRVYRGVQLTDAGEALFGTVQDGFATIEQTIDRLQHKQRNPSLNILTDFSLAAYWLMPRLPLFRREHPQVDVSLMTNQGVFDWRSQVADVAVVFSSAQSLESLPCLCREEVFPVCSPGFLKEHGPIEDMAALRRVPKLKLTADEGQSWLDWPGYFDGAGDEAHPESSELTFNNYPLLIQAAIAGQGVGLGWRGQVDDMIERGILVGLEHLNRHTDSGYGVIDIRPNESSDAKVAFIDWILTCR